jgi:hypothetical protein
LFSAAWRPGVSPALTLWSLSDVILVTSPYAVDEAERNLDAPDARARLYRLLRQIEVVDEAPPTVTLPKRVELALKDQPILLAAIHGRCTHLLTGDHKHFGALFGQSLKGLRILTIRQYLEERGIGDDSAEPD